MNLEFAKSCFRFRKDNLVPLPNAFRILHNEFDNLTCDKLGSVLFYSFYGQREAFIDCKQLCQAYSNYLCEELNEDLHFFLRWMPNRGASNETLSYQSPHCPENWIITEHSYQFLLSRTRGTSSGIFLDQRDNRKWLLDNSKNKHVLNLFSYSCAFSLAAAQGGAKKVLSVDTSKSYLDWGKKQFELNDLKLETYEFWAWDALEFLVFAQKKEMQFDLIVCDPPSFGRSPKAKFQIHKDYKKLIRLCKKILSPNGCILFSSNYQEWIPHIWQDKLKQLGECFSCTNLPLDYSHPQAKPSLFSCKIH